MRVQTSMFVFLTFAFAQSLVVKWALKKMQDAHVSPEMSLIIDLSRYVSQPGEHVDVRMVAIDLLRTNMLPPITFADKISGKRAVTLPAAPLHAYLQAATASAGISVIPPPPLPTTRMR
jgi:hypothetical protein